MPALSTLLLATALPAMANSADPTLPSRPLTYPVNDQLSDGPMENFRELHVDPFAIVKDLEPVRGPHIEYVEIEVAAPRVAITRGAIKIGEKVQFVTGKSDLDAASHGLLDEVAKALVDTPAIEKVRIEGHTDSRGNARTNQRLSQARARAVFAYLADKGVDKDRMVAIGIGEDEPLDPANTEAAWETNRRVEFDIETLNKDKLKRELPERVSRTKRVPKNKPPATGDLPIMNTSSSYADVMVGDAKVGRIGPYTNGRIKGVKSGFYNVTFTIQNGFSHTEEVQTAVIEGIFMPGGESARPSADEGIINSWHDDPAKGYKPKLPGAPAGPIGQKKGDGTSAKKGAAATPAPEAAPAEEPKPAKKPDPAPATKEAGKKEGTKKTGDAGGEAE